MATLEEQETIIIANRSEDYVSIWTSSTPDIAYFKKAKGFELVKETTYNGEIESAEFRVPKERVNVRKILKRQMSDEQRAEASERLARVRQNMP